jgi:hypothetical protein
MKLFFQILGLLPLLIWFVLRDIVEHYRGKGRTQTAKKPR